MPYLQHIKLCGVPHSPYPPPPGLNASYPQLGILADFMEVGTNPLRFKKLTQQQREERWAKTNVCRLDYPKDNGDVVEKRFTKSQELRTALEGEAKGWNDSNIQFRLYVVEDLSRDVIELLGDRYDVDPAFFREHILDFSWFNVRDPWKDSPNLVKDSRNQSWTQIRYVTARYFENVKSFERGEREAADWNVQRRPDRDFNSSFWDKPEAVVSQTRSRASFWLKRKKREENEEEVKKGKPEREPKEGGYAETKEEEPKEGEAKERWEKNGRPKEGEPKQGRPRKGGAAIGENCSRLIIAFTSNATIDRNHPPRPDNPRGLPPLAQGSPPRTGTRITTCSRGPRGYPSSKTLSTGPADPASSSVAGTARSRPRTSPSKPCCSSSVPSGSPWLTTSRRAWARSTGRSPNRRTSPSKGANTPSTSTIP